MGLLTSTNFPTDWSSLTNTPISVFSASFPVNRNPNCGSMIRRVKYRSTGVAKKFAFSWKNGRFSGKNTSKRWLVVVCGWSDSTWLKSGFTVTSSTNLSLMISFESRPASIFAGLLVKNGMSSLRASRT